MADAPLGSLRFHCTLCNQPDCLDGYVWPFQLGRPFYAVRCGCYITCILSEDEMTMMPNTALEPTAATPAVGGHTPIHACGFPRRGSALNR